MEGRGRLRGWKPGEGVEVREEGIAARGEMKVRRRMEVGERWNPGEFLLHPVRETAGLCWSLAAAP